MLPSGEIKVYIEKPDVKNGFHYAACFLPRYRWEDVRVFTDQKMSRWNRCTSRKECLLQMERKFG